MVYSESVRSFSSSTKEEEEIWWKRDPLVRYRKYLTAKKWWSDKKEEELQAEFKKQMDLEVAEFEAMSDFQMDAPFDHVYGTTHAVI